MNWFRQFCWTCLHLKDPRVIDEIDIDLLVLILIQAKKKEKSSKWFKLNWNLFRPLGYPYEQLIGIKLTVIHSQNEYRFASSVSK